MIKMGANVKMHVQIVLLLLTVMSAFVSGASFLGLNIKATIFTVDDYDQPVTADITLINTEEDYAESNYHNTVSFYLYTKDRQNDSVKLYIGDTNSLRIGQFDPKKPTVFITHGWLNFYQSPACIYVRNAYFQRGDYNIILIDWSVLSTNELFWVSGQVEKIAKHVSRMIDFLESQGMDLSNTTMVGHSFGAHLVGLASYYAKRKVNYIVGLDPGGPGFRLKGKGSRLSKDVANYVQAIHTTAILGLNDQLGHSDFYVNGAIDQIGCVIPVVCGHLRSYEYFAESLSSNGFVARKCDSYSNFKLGLCDSNESAYMGGATPDRKVKGTYYLDTNLKPPFAKF